MLVADFEIIIPKPFPAALILSPFGLRLVVTLITRCHHQLGAYRALAMIVRLADSNICIPSMIAGTLAVIG